VARTTTVRVDERTHALLLDISRATGAPLIDTLRDAAEALRRQRFAQQVAGELSVLRRDPAAWEDYVADADLALGDGLG
jgi:hypothetical protein